MLEEIKNNMARYKITIFQEDTMSDIETKVNKFLDRSGRRLVNISIATHQSDSPVIEGLDILYTACVGYIDEDH